jgi:hypothetical protein
MAVPLVVVLTVHRLGRFRHLPTASRCVEDSMQVVHRLVIEREKN